MTRNYWRIDHSPSPKSLKNTASLAPGKEKEEEESWREEKTVIRSHYEIIITYK